MTDTYRLAAVPVGNVYGKYDTRNALERAMVGAFLRRFDALLPRHAPRVVFEIGAGEGFVATRVREHYPDARFYGLDLPHGDLMLQWRERGIDGVFADAHRLPLRDASCDLVLAIEVLEHLPHPDAALAEIARVAAGDVILSVPLEPWWRLGNVLRGRYVARLGDTPGHLQHWGRGSFHRLVGRHLDVVSVHSPLPWTMVHARAVTR